MGKADADHTPELPSLAKLQRLSAADWVPLNEAFARIKAALSSSDLALRDLHDDLRGERLPSAERSIARDGTETSGELEASFWQQVTLRRWLDGVVVSFNDPGHVQPSSVWYFVARQELDRLYPPAGSAPVDHDDASEEPVRAVDRAKVVLLALYPTKAKMPASLKAATRDVEVECRKRRLKPPSEDRVQRAAEQLGYRPPRKPRPSRKRQ